MRLAGKVALVTGAASGMGKSEATIFAREGARVVVADILEAEGKEVAKTIGDAARFVKLDVTSEREWESAVAFAEREFGKLNLLVNNAGISGTYTADLTSTEAWDRVMEINAKGVFLGMKCAVPALTRAGGGAIVNISSISGFAGQQGVHMAYNASKGAVRIMTKTAAVQWAADSIRVNSVHPGFMPAMRTSVGSANPEWRGMEERAAALERGVGGGGIAHLLG